jgi:putative intracellular protease/amidase
LIENFYKHKKPIVFVCHAPAALVGVKAPNGEPLVKGKELTGFSNSEEEAVKLTKVVPFLLEDELKKLGGHYSNGPDWGVYVKKDGLLITGQNPASSEAAAKQLLELLQR